MTKLNSKEIYFFTNNLNVLIQSGITLQEALFICKSIKFTTNYNLVISQLYESITNGNSFSDSLKSTKQFSSFYISLIQVGELSGDIKKILSALVKYLENQKQKKNKLLQTLMYPCIVLFTTILAFIFIAYFVLPKLKEIFISVSQINSTNFQIQFQDILNSAYISGCIIFSIILLIPLLLFIYKKNKTVAYFIDSLILKIPFLREYIIESEIASFCFTMNILTSSGLPLTECFDYNNSIIKNRKLLSELKTVQSLISNGNKVSYAFNQTSFPDYFKTWINIGESTGDPSKTFSEMYHYYSQKQQNNSTTLASMLEPISILVTGGLIIFFVTKIILPIFSMLGGM